MSNQFVYLNADSIFAFGETSIVLKRTPLNLIVEQLDQSFTKRRLIGILSSTEIVLGISCNSLWYAHEVPNAQSFQIFRMLLKNGEIFKFAETSANCLPCGVFENPPETPTVVGMRDDSVVQITSSGKQIPFFSDRELKSVNLPVIHFSSFDCLHFSESVKKKFLLSWSNGNLQSKICVSDSTQLAVRIGKNLIAVECTPEGHVSRVILKIGPKVRTLHSAKKPMWPIALEVIDKEIVIFHYSCFGKRLSVAFEGYKKGTFFPPWHNPYRKCDLNWVLSTNLPASVLDAKFSNAIKNISWLGPRQKQRSGTLWSPSSSASGAVMRLPGGPFMPDDQFYDRWIELFVKSGFYVFNPHLPGAVGHGDDLKKELTGESLVRNFHLEVSYAASAFEKATGMPASTMGVWGESFGGYTAMFAAMKATEWRPRFAIIVNGFGDLLFDNKISEPLTKSFMIGILGAPENDPLRYTLASASTWINKDIPPVLFVVSKLDTNVIPSNSFRLAALLRCTQSKVSILKLSHSTHLTFNSLDWARCAKTTLRFLENIPPKRSLVAPSELKLQVKKLFNGGSLFDATPNPVDSLFVRCIKSLAVVNQKLWDLEDEARSPIRSLAEIGILKQTIDLHNQRRHDLIEDIDKVIAVFFPNTRQRNIAPRTESPASAIDRLTILSLRLLSLRSIKAATDRRDHVAREVNESWNNLFNAILALFDDIYAGRCAFQPRNTHKLYNDPSLSKHGDFIQLLTLEKENAF